MPQPAPILAQRWLVLTRSLLAGFTRPLTEMQLSDLKPGLSLTGLEPQAIVSVVATVPIGADAIQLIYKLPSGTLRERLVTATDVGSLSVPTTERPWSFEGDGEAFKLTLAGFD